MPQSCRNPVWQPGGRRTAGACEPPVTVESRLLESNLTSSQSGDHASISARCCHRRDDAFFASLAIIHDEAAGETASSPTPRLPLAPKHPQRSPIAPPDGPAPPAHCLAPARQRFTRYLTNPLLLATLLTPVWRRSRRSPARAWGAACHGARATAAATAHRPAPRREPRRIETALPRHCNRRHALRVKRSGTRAPSLPPCPHVRLPPPPLRSL